MCFSHHSHSGQFCWHAKDRLEQIVLEAIKKGFEMYALTEHMPRGDEDLYPEEIEAGVTSTSLKKLFDDFYYEARRLQGAYASQIKILVGVEVDWIRPSSAEYISDLLKKYPLDTLIGAIHHVHAKPIDFDHSLFAEAREISGGNDENIFKDYFDLQYEMLRALKPPIVGHFDVIRMKADYPGSSFMQFPGVWHKILRNLDFVVQYGGILELNSAALRKGMDEPYPKAEICRVFLEKGGQFTLSDDSHGVDQVGTNYDKLLTFVEETGIKDIVYLEKGSTTRDSRFPNISVSTLAVWRLVQDWDPSGK